MIVVCFFVEIFKRGNRFGTGLNFIENNQRVFGKDLLALIQRKLLYDCLRRHLLEEVMQSLVLFKVAINAVGIFLPREIVDNIGFADLSRTLQNQRFSVGTALPSN